MKNEIQQIESLLSQLKKAKEQDSIEFTMSSQELPFKEEKPYLIRTVTLYYTGKVKTIKGKWIQLEQAAWIPDTGRWQEATEKGTFNEIEPFAYDPWSNTDGIIDFGEIAYSLPAKQK